MNKRDHTVPTDSAKRPAHRRRAGAARATLALCLALCLGVLSQAAPAQNPGAPTSADYHYMASLNQSSWYWERHTQACHLIHAIPRFGLAVFSRAADGDVALRVYTGNPPAESHTVHLWSAPRSWDPSKMRRIGSVDGAPGPETFRFGSDMSVRVLRELERGAYPTLSFDDWHTPDTTLAVSLSNAGFRPKYNAFMRCQPNADNAPGSPSAQSADNGNASTVTVLEPNPASDGVGAADGVISVATRQTTPDQTTVTLQADNGRPASPPSTLLARHGQAIIPAELVEAEREAERQQREREQARLQAEAEAAERRKEQEAAAEAGNGDDGSGQIAKPTRAVSDVVYFVSGDTSLTRTELQRVNAFLDALDEDNHSTITVTGHTGGSAPEAYNEQLGRERAGAVRDYLVSQGIPENRIVVATAGSRNPAAEDDSPFEQASNRRARLHVGERD